MSEISDRMTMQSGIVTDVADAIMTRIFAGKEPMRDAIKAELQAFTSRLMEHQGWKEWPSGSTV